MNLRASRSTELFSRESFEQTHVEVAHLLRHVIGQGRDVRLRFPRGPRVHKGLVIPYLTIVLPDEFLAEFHLPSPLVFLDIPEPILVRGAERIDEHEPSLTVHRELLLAVDVDEPPPLDVLVEPRIDLEDGVDEVIVLGPAELRDGEGLVPREFAIYLLELRRHFDERLRQRLAVGGHVARRKSGILGLDPAPLDPVMERSGHVIPRDHLEWDQEVRRLRRDLIVVRDPLDAPHSHAVPAFESEEMGPDPQVLDELEPMGGGAAERLSLVPHLRGDDLVEDADLVGEEELELSWGDLVDLLHLALPKEPNRPAPAAEDEPSS